MSEEEPLVLKEGAKGGEVARGGVFLDLREGGREGGRKEG